MSPILSKTEPDYLLLVEDNPDDELLITRAFGRQLDVNRIKVVHTGIEAVEFLERIKTASELPKAVILDVNLPKKNGIDVLKAIRHNEKTKYLPVVMLTSSDEKRDLLDSYNLGANSYIRKPVNYEDFSRIIHEIGAYWLHINKPVSI